MNISRINSSRSISSVISKGSESDEVASPEDAILYKVADDPVSLPQRWLALKNKLFAMLDARNTNKHDMQ